MQKTGEISHKLGRGRHTTRYAELLSLPFGGLIADTPGFSLLEMPSVPKEELANYYPEFAPFLASCRFMGCLHHNEPDCGVKQGVESLAIDSGRYQRYLALLELLTLKEENYD